MASKPEPFLTLGFAAIDWIEHFLVHGPGDVQGQPIELDDEFAEFIVKAYRVDTHGSRRVRRAFLSRAKGRSKSGLAAMIAVFEALGPCRFDHFAEDGEVSGWGYEYEPGEPVGKPLTYVEILNVATEEGQAGNTYDAIYYMLNPETCSPELLAEFGKLDIGLTRINLPDSRGFIEPVTSADSSKDGGKSTFIVADETHLWRLPRLKRLHSVMTRNLLKRKLASGWMLETSTMYGEGEGSVAEGTHEYAKAIAEGRRRDGSLLFDHRQASMEWDLTKRADRLKALKESYGPASEWMDLGALADSWDDPQVTEADYRRYWLNQPVPTEEETPSAVPGWRSRIVDRELPPAEAIGIAIDLERTCGSIAAAAAENEKAVVGAVDHRIGVRWLVDEAVRIQRERFVRIVIDEKGPAAGLIDGIELAGGVVTRVNLEDYIGACSKLVDRVDDGTLEIAADTPGGELEQAFDASRWRPVGDGRQAFGRRKSTRDISMLEAVTLAAWGLEAVDVALNVW